VKEFGNIHLLLNSAGVATAGPLFFQDGDVMSNDEIMRVMMINVVGTFNVTKHAAA
jgi:NAD(P)-dependent dehydrogenase (short-subunit alcohol dehydrogenase family)